MKLRLAILALCVLDTAVAEDIEKCKCFMYNTFVGNENDTNEKEYCLTPEITSWNTLDCTSCIASSRNEHKVKLPCPQNGKRDFSQLPKEVTKEVMVQFLESYEDENEKVIIL